mgnify:CR=1 FL=1
MALNDKQEKFCREYAKHGNAAKAYATAYPEASAKSANANAGRMMANDNVLEKIRQLRAEATADSKITRQKIAKELAEMGFTSVDLGNLKHGDKLKALELLAKMLGFLDGRVSEDDDTGDVEDSLQRHAREVMGKLVGGKVEQE